MLDNAASKTVETTRSPLSRQVRAARERFADFLANKAQQAVIMNELTPYEGDLDAFIEEHGTPDSSVTWKQVKVLEYPGMFVAKDLPTGEVLVYDNVYFADMD